jgi:hypothetical protein
LRSRRAFARWGRGASLRNRRSVGICQWRIQLTFASTGVAPDLRKVRG